MVGTRLAHYHILERIGSGGMGEVYRAHDSRLGRDVALKTLHPEVASDPEAVRRFHHEARALAALRHPNIVTIHAVEEIDGVRFLAMELVDGQPLSAVIPPGGLDRDRFLEIAIPLADALAAAHAHGITHRDLKPANILITPDGDVRVLDFGLAKQLESTTADGDPGDDESTRSMTSAGTILGTLPYMSPEQVQGRPVDPRTDLFSLGVVFHEMATGIRPFEGVTRADLVAAILRDEPPIVTKTNPEIPLRLALLIEQCLRKDPDARPASAAILRDQLEAFREDSGRRRRATPRTLAVRPFAEIPRSDDAGLGEGLASELLVRLARVEALRMAPREASFRPGPPDEDAMACARRLEVDGVLDGSIERIGDRLRVAAVLVRGRDGAQLWSSEWDRPAPEVVAVQEEIVAGVVRALDIVLTPGEKRFLTSPTTDDFQAYEYYLRGRRLLYQFRKSAMETALQMFTLAIRRDPGFALAWAGIANCGSFLFVYADRSEASLREADRASRRALELDPGLAEAHVARGQFLSLSGRHEEAAAEFETAIRLNPRSFDAWYQYGRDRFAGGDLARAAECFETAERLDTEDYQCPLLMGQIHDEMGRAEEAAASRRRGVERVERRLASQPDDVRALYMGANGLTALGQFDRALEWTEIALSIAPDDSMVLYNVACIHALGGRVEAALDCVERAVDAGLKQRGWIEHDHDLAPIRSHPRYRALVERLARLESRE